MITKQEYTHRRSVFFNKMTNNSIAVLFAGSLIKSSADQTHPFEVNRNFYYLTGINQPNSILMLVKIAGACNTFLFIDEMNENQVKWTGRLLTNSEAQEISGVADILYTKYFDAKVDLMLDGQKSAYGHIENVYLDLEAGLYIEAEKTTKDLAFNWSKQYPGITCQDAHRMIVIERMIKSDAEIAEIRETIRTTKLGLEAILCDLKPGLYEYQIAALFAYKIADFNHSGLSFPTIVAGGENAVILHYPTANQRLKPDSLVLLDLGAEKDLYRADITRTYPVSGKFSTRAKEIYEMVLRCNKAVASFIRPGITIDAIQGFAFEFLKSELISHGYIAIDQVRKQTDDAVLAKEIVLNGQKLTPEEVDVIYKEKLHEAVFRYYYHNVSHHLGLDCHDASFRDMKLEPGMVITDEPGLYFAEYGIGVRIEDDILVTEDGSEVLSKDIIKEVDEIEAWMAEHQKA